MITPPGRCSASLAEIIEAIGRGATESGPDIDGLSFVDPEGQEVGSGSA
jgi:hypothetical protein